MAVNFTRRRGLAGAFAFCALAIVLLLASHPGAEGAHTISDLIRSEAAGRLIDGWVHGGFIAVSWLLVVCFALLSRSLGLENPAVMGGFVAFCMGSVALSASMTLDGLVIPAIAVRYSGSQDAQNLAAANTLFVFCATAIRMLMPMGLLFQALGMLCWSRAILGQGWRRVIGVTGIAGALAFIAATLLLSSAGPILLMGGIVLLCAWYLLIAGGLWYHEA